MNILVTLGLLAALQAPPAPDKPAAKRAEQEKPKPPMEAPPQERRDPTESDLPRAYAAHVPVPAIALRAIVVAADRPGSAIISVDGKNCRVQKGDTLTLGAIPAVLPPSGGYGNAPRRPEAPAARPPAGIPAALHIASITADELRIEVVPSGEVIVVR